MSTKTDTRRNGTLLPFLVSSELYRPRLAPVFTKSVFLTLSSLQIVETFLLIPKNSIVICFDERRHVIIIHYFRHRLTLLKTNVTSSQNPFVQAVFSVRSCEEGDR